MIKPVIVGVDRASGMGDAVDWAADEAERRGVRLRLVHVWLRQAYDTPEGRNNADTEREGQRLLQDAAARATARQVEPAVDVELLEGGPRDSLMSLSPDAELLVTGARGSGGFPRLLVGSTSLYLAAAADCPVVVVPQAAPRAGRGGVVVGIDGKGPCDDSLRFAFELARRRELPLRAVHAWRYPLVRGPGGHSSPPVYEEGHVAEEAAQRLAEVLTVWRRSYPDVPVQEDLVRSGAAKHLVALSATGQLVVVGRRGSREGPIRRLGSVGQAVVNYAQCPVAVVPERHDQE